MTADRDATGSGPREGSRRQLWLVLGGVRSGKSSFALSLAQRIGGRVLFVATAQAGDEEMAARIERHRDRRPTQWQTLEAPLGIGAALQETTGAAEVIVVDCLGFLVANVMGVAGEDLASAEARADAEVEGLLEAYRGAGATLIVVSNEVGMGVVPPYPSGRVFRDVLGRANQRLAQEADAVYWMVAGMPLELKAAGRAVPWGR